MGGLCSKKKNDDPPPKQQQQKAPNGLGSSGNPAGSFADVSPPTPSAFGSGARKLSIVGGPLPAGEEVSADLPDHVVEKFGSSASLKSGLTIRYASRSCAGIHGQKRKENQDAFLVCDSIKDSERLSVYAILDGHGINGKKISNFVRDIIEPTVSLVRHRDLHLSSEDVLKELFNSIQNQVAVAKINSANSGTTLATILRTDRKIYCANAGDSRCVSAYRGDDGELVVQDLSQDHKPDLPDECARITARGGVVSPIIDEEGKPVGPARVWIKSKRLTEPGLAMSRSIGDRIAHLIGVDHTPDVIPFDIPHDRELYVVMCSDGVWEYITSEEAMELCVNAPSLEEGVRQLCTLADERWISEDDGECDDITALLLCIQPVGEVEPLSDLEPESTADGGSERGLSNEEVNVHQQQQQNPAE